MPIETTEPVNLVRSVFVCNVFNFFFSASKACLLPFLTIYLRFLGLSATQTGFIIGAKTFSRFFFAPLWSKCAIDCHKRRLMLMIALFLMAATYLPLTLIPALNGNINSCKNVPSTISVPIITTATQADKGLKVSMTTQSPNFYTSTVHTQIVTNSSSNHNNSIPQEKKFVKNKHEDKLLEEAKHIIMTAMDKFGMNSSKISTMKSDDLLDLYHEVMSNALMMRILEARLSDSDKNVLRRFLKSHNATVRFKRGVTEYLGSIKETLIQKFHEKLQKVEQNIFAVVMVVLVVGEIFCSPVEKIADDSWFEFLEHIDDMEKYGKHRIWSSLACIIFPIIVTLVVDNTKCLFGMNIDPFMFHFYSFGCLLGLTFLIGFFYPMPTSEKSKYKSKFVTALRLTCFNCGGVLYMFTLTIMGFIYAAYNNYLFWLIQDLGGKESTMGMCIMISSLSELVVLVFSTQIVKRLGNRGMVSVSLFFLAARLLYYSYLWTPWAVLPAEITHAITHTLMWFVVLSNSAFRVSPNIDRAVRSILSSAYFGVGFGLGSMICGFLIDTYGMRTLFRALSVLSIGWCPVFFLLQRCYFPKKETDIKYTRLLQSDDHSEDDIEDDWLEHALKDK